MKYFRVKTGFGKTDFLSIEESELAKAIRAQVSGKVAIFKTGTIAGNHIMSITPDWNKELGLNPDYTLTGEDFNELPRGRVADYQLAIENGTEEVMAQIEGRKPQLKLPGVRKYTQGLTAIGDLIEKK